MVQRLLLIIGKAEDVFKRVEEMKNQEQAGGGVIYAGERRINGLDVQVSRIEIFLGDIEGKTICRPKISLLDPGPSQTLYNHSPDGFEWGYSGSGPAQLALALLLDATGDKVLALKYHQDFKERFVAGWRASWSIHAEQIRAFAEMKQNYEKSQEYERNIGDGQ